MFKLYYSNHFFNELCIEEVIGIKWFDHNHKEVDSTPNDYIGIEPMKNSHKYEWNKQWYELRLFISFTHKKLDLEARII